MRSAVQVLCDSTAPLPPVPWGEFLVYDLDACPSTDPMSRETWVRNLLHAGAERIGAHWIVSVDADEVCLNPSAVVRDLQAGNWTQYARWRTVVARFGAVEIGPGPEQWSPYSGFCLSLPGDQLKPPGKASVWDACTDGAYVLSRDGMNGPFVRGRATSTGPSARGPGLFIHRAWENADRKLYSWSHARDGRDLALFAARLCALRSARTLAEFLDVAEVLGVVDNWSPYPDAPWRGYCLWRTEDLERLDGEPFFHSLANEQKENK